jgi:transposase-like protein
LLNFVANQVSRRPRRNHSAAFKAKVAIEALADGKTIAEIAQKHDVHPNQMTEWRRQLIERAAGAFGGTVTPEAPPVDLKALRAKIGQLTLENDFWRARSPRRDCWAQSDDRP